MYGTTTHLEYTIQRGAQVSFNLPGMLEGYPAFLAPRGTAWVLDYPAARPPAGLSVGITRLGEGTGVSFVVTLQGVTNVDPGAYAFTLRASPDGVELPLRPQWAVTWVVTIKVEGTAAISEPPPAAPGGDQITFAAARASARAGQRVAMVGWADRWLEYERPGKWYMVVVAPITRALVSRHIIEMAPECSPAWWHSRWVLVA